MIKTVFASIYLIFIFLSSALALGLETKDKIPQDFYEKAYYNYCAHKIEEGDKILSDRLATNPDDAIAFFMLKTLISERANKFIEDGLSKVNRKVIPHSDMERLSFVEVMIKGRNSTLSDIRTLLKFESLVPEIEAKRLLWLSYVDWLQGKDDDSFRKCERVIELTNESITDPFLCVISLEITDQELLQRQTEYRHRARNLFKDGTLNAKVLASRLARVDGSNIFEFSNSAYLDCEMDEGLGLELVSALIHRARHQDKSWKQYQVDADLERAEKIIDKITHENTYYSPMTDLLHLELLIDQKKGGIGFFGIGSINRDMKKISESKEYLNPEEKEYFASVENYVVAQRKEELLVSTFCLVFVLGFIWLLKRIGRTKRIGVAEKSSIIEEGFDKEAFEKADSEAMKSDEVDRVVIANFDTSQGYSHGKMVDLMNYLNKNGIDADYTTNTLGFMGVGGMTMFSLRVPPEKVEAAEQLLVIKPDDSQV